LDISLETSVALNKSEINWEKGSLSLILVFWDVDEPPVNRNARDVGYLGPLSSLIFLAVFFQQRTIGDMKLQE
jgi:hypothetical protein